MAPSEAAGIDWKRLLAQSFSFLTFENAFRLGTQSYTRKYLEGPFFADWGKAIGNLHGWGDGDDFLINYVGHPMQGAVMGYVFVQNDRRYKQVEFGRNRDYWMGRARATLFSFVYSEAFELGPFSEASIGNTSAYYPQQGLVDHAITPTVGLLWMIGEDALDRYVIRSIEQHTDRRIVKILARGGLNPSRTAANVLRLELPWYRDTRSNHLGSARLLSTSGSEAEWENALAARQQTTRHTSSSLPSFEFSTHYSYTQLATGKPGSLPCNGGGATASYSLNRWTSLTADVDGCTMLKPGSNTSGDSLSYMLGPHLAWRTRSGWTPFVQLLVGGNKFSIETVDPSRKPANMDSVQEIDKPAVHSSYTTQDQTNAFAIRFGAGLDYTVHPALALRLFEVDDLHTWARSLNDRYYANNLTVRTGVVLRFGTW